MRVPPVWCLDDPVRTCTSLAENLFCRNFCHANATLLNAQCSNATLLYCSRRKIKIKYLSVAHPSMQCPADKAQFGLMMEAPQNWNPLYSKASWYGTSLISVSSPPTMRPFGKIGTILLNFPPALGTTAPNQKKKICEA